MFDVKTATKRENENTPHLTTWLCLWGELSCICFLELASREILKSQPIQLVMLPTAKAISGKAHYSWTIFRKNISLQSDGQGLLVTGDEMGCTGCKQIMWPWLRSKGSPSRFYQ